MKSPYYEDPTRASASNREFDAKKNGYFSDHKGISPFVLTTQVLRQGEWTPDLLTQRQQELMGQLVDLWRL